MNIFTAYLTQIQDVQHRTRIKDILEWVSDTFPNLVPKIAWNQPIFTDHGTFIVGFSAAKKHLAVAPERVAIVHFSSEIMQAGYAHSKELLRIGWNQPVDYALLEKIIAYNIADKAACTAFWRK